MYKIAFNAFGRNLGGVESYIYNQIKAILSLDKTNSYYLFVSNDKKYIYEDLLKFENFKIISYNINSSNPFVRVFCENTMMPFDLIKHKIDLIHNLCGYVPYVLPCKSVVTIHDIAAFYYHDNMPEYKETRLSYRYFKRVVSHIARKANKITAISEFTKQQLIEKFQIDNDKIDVVPLSYDTRKDKISINQDVLGKFNISKPYILSVSVIRPHKNFDFLVRVFNKLKSEFNSPHQLVIVGGVHFGVEKFLKEIDKSPFKKDILYLGNLKAEELASIYNFADIFVFPSLYEGFGIPLLEAMRFNVPVISSNAASLTEVGGDTCLYFDPQDETDACDKILTVLKDETVRNNLLSNQQARLVLYSWESAANKLLSIYNNILGNKDD
jgi:glycosyltransferase involved in cell wall biosynthesis